MSDRVRTSVLFSVLFCIAACGGGGGAICTDGTTDGVSCTSAQDQMCTASGKKPVAMCLGGQWSTPCTCMGTMTSGVTMTPPAGPMNAVAVAVCGNNKAEGDELCDGSDLKGMTCAALGMSNASAMLKCNGRCTLDTSLCFASTASASGGTGAAQGGTGARAMGTAGSGGSGR